MLGILRKYRRAVSPVISSIFLFAVILGAISVSLGIIYPQVQTLNDNIEVDTAGSTLLSVDNDIKTLIFNGVEGTVFNTLDNGRTGLFYLDNVSQSRLQVYNDSSGSPTELNLTHSRLRIRQIVDQDPIQAGNHRYLIGSGEQNFLYLNDSNRESSNWAILNQSRPQGSDQVFSSLSYRYVLSSNRLVYEEPIYTVVVNIDIQMVNITTPRDNSVGTPKHQIEIQYNGVETKSFTFPVATGENFKLVAQNTLDDPNSGQQQEIPVNLENPIPDELIGFGEFEVNLNFIFHQVEILI